MAILPLGLLFIAGGLWCALGPLGPKGTFENRTIFLTVCPALGLCFLALWWHVQMYRLEILADRFRLRGIRGTREHLNSDIGGYRLFDVGNLTSKEIVHLFDRDGRRVAILMYWLDDWPTIKSWIAATFPQ
jgi:hypothetical protein